MTLSELFAERNFFTSKALLPLTKIHSQQDKDAAREKGFAPGYTYDEWREAYPHIDANKVAYLSETNVGTVYFDREKALYLNLGIIDRQLLVSPDGYEERMLRAIKGQEKRLEEKDYIGLLTPMADGMRMEALSQILKFEGSTPHFYDTFMSLYTVGDFQTGRIDKTVIAALPKCKSDEQKERTKKRLDKLMGDKESITVYRGEADSSTHWQEAMSWTPDINIANLFATKHGHDGRILKAEVQRADGLEYFPQEGEDGTEDELLVLPGRIRQVDITSLLDFESSEITLLLDDALPWYQDWRAKLKDLYSENNSSLHGAKHSLRVLFFATLLGVSQQLSDDQMIRLCDAAIFHDIGRINEGIDSSHGSRSAKIFREEYGKEPVTEFLITTHCWLPKKAYAHLGKSFSGSEKDAIWQLFQILQDADSLDRIRFGIERGQHNGALDLNYLHLELSKRMTPLAKQCFSQLKL